ncbi:hypothetical protein O9H85_25925 [Paenibacillus filicis]|uniref:Uncharacterized protein n=1 Tax=Paenibacillus gyeongsangnamensis TaxID=3388067 RepID=A0ABT4QG49_9BACL|nr:hypothetical protein [Paenibacillus filicis]MCZ8515788.1 hypothetical protein [Paenibacillus filicis]
MQVRGRRFRPVWMGIGAIIIGMVLLFAISMADELPGGFADWRMSHAIGLNETIRIPLGRTPDEAVQKFRHFPFMQVIHREPLEGGVLLFIKRFTGQEGSDLQVEYVRKAWFGWKWVWGGGYGIGGNKNPKSPKSALNYMIMPRVNNSPFPMVFGDILDASVKSIIVTAGGAGSGQYTAKLAGAEAGHAIWFAFLPSSAEPPYDIQGFNPMGAPVAHLTTNDPHGSGSIDLRD